VEQGFLVPFQQGDVVWEVSEVYSSGAVEWFIQVWGAIITQVTTGDVGFLVVTGLVWVGWLAIMAEDPLGEWWDSHMSYEGMAREGETNGNAQQDGQNDDEPGGNKPQARPDSPEGRLSEKLIDGAAAGLMP
jgi:hypothetical protein